MGVGKTSLIRCLQGNKHTVAYQPTFQGQHTIRRVPTKEGNLKVIVWDTAGSECFRATNSTFVRNVSCCILVFSLAERDSFNSIVNYWWPKAKEWSREMRGLLIGNKVEEHDPMTLSPLEIKQFCNAERLRYWETSAVTGQNVVQCFQSAAHAIQRELRNFECKAHRDEGEREKWAPATFI